MSVNASTVAEAKRVAQDFLALCNKWEREAKKEEANRRLAEKSDHPYWYDRMPVGISAAVKRRSHDLRVALAELRRTN